MDWTKLDQFYGGTVILNWTYNDGYSTQNETPIQFEIQGHTPSETAVQADIQSSPWFYQYILGQESHSSQFSNSSFNPHRGSLNYPIVGGNPEGIGIAQLDYQTSTTIQKPQHTPAQINDTKVIYTVPHARCGSGNQCPQPELFWNYAQNLKEGMSKLNDFINTGVSEWQRQFKLMQASLSNAGLNSQNPANWIFPPAYQSKDCNFSNTWPVATSYNGFEAAFIIRSYNAGSAPNTYVWLGAVPPTPSNPGSWSSVNDPAPPKSHCGGYLACVCNQ